jgi:hypothetical protein
MSERETVDELPFAADRCPCVEKLRTCYQLLLASETVQCSWCPSWAVSSCVFGVGVWYRVPVRSVLGVIYSGLDVSFGV